MHVGSSGLDEVLKVQTGGTEFKAAFFPQVCASLLLARRPQLPGLGGPRVTDVRSGCFSDLFGDEDTRTQMVKGPQDMPRLCLLDSFGFLLLRCTYFNFLKFIHLKGRVTERVRQKELISHLLVHFLNAWGSRG